MSRQTKIVGTFGIVFSLALGIVEASAQCPTPPSGHDCKCNGDDTKWVCADWSAGAAPVEGADFVVDYTCTGCSDAPRVELVAGDDAWVVYSGVN